MPKEKEHIKRAKELGDDSWELINFNELQTNASTESQVKALNRDRDWLTSHVECVAAGIDDLIQDIRGY